MWASSSENRILLYVNKKDADQPAHPHRWLAPLLFSLWKVKYTETIKFCPLDVYVCQFLMYKRISFMFLHYKLISFRNVMHLNEIDLITSRSPDNSENTSTLKIKSHNIDDVCPS